MLFHHSEHARGGLVFSVAIAANIVFQLFAGFLLSAFGVTLTESFPAFLIVQTLLPVCVFAATYWYVGTTGATFQSAFSVRKPSRSADWAVAVGLGLAVCFFSGFLSNLVSAGLTAVGIPNSLSGIPVGENLFELILFFIVMAILPALSEEFVFRGALISFSRTSGTAACCLASGALFALMHMNLHQMLNAFLVGSLLALMTMRSGSIFPAVIVHFLNNVTTIVQEMVNAFVNLPSVFLGFSALDLGLAAAGAVYCAVVLRFYLRRSNCLDLRYEPEDRAVPAGTRRDFWLAAAFGIALAVVLTVANIVSAFAA